MFAEKQVVGTRRISMALLILAGSGLSHAPRSPSLPRALLARQLGSSAHSASHFFANRASGSEARQHGRSQRRSCPLPPLSAINMRTSSLLVLGILAACASSPPSGCPCHARGFGYESFGASTFIDTDDDGIPDARVNDSTSPASVSEQVRQDIGRACTAAVQAVDEQDLDAALAKLAATVAEARRKLDAGQ